MKKIIIVACFFACIVATLIIYGNTREPMAENIIEEAIPEDDENLIVVGFSQVGSESDWRLANTESIRKAFSEKNGYYLILEDARQKQENQLKALRKFILQEVDYIILDPVVETGWDAVLQEAKDAGIPVILADRMVQVEDNDLYTCWVGSNFFREGERAGEWLVRYLKKQKREEDEINIVTLQGTLGSSSQMGRTAGFAKVMKTQKNWKMLDMQDGDFTQTKGKEVMETYLKKYPDIDVVISENDNMTFGAIDAIREAGKTCGAYGNIIIISFDAVKAALESMIQGKINVDFECNPILGPMLSEVIQQLEQGKSVEKINYIEESYFDTTMNIRSLIEEREY